MAEAYAEDIGSVAKSTQLGASLERAYSLARDQSHPAVTLEHLLFALTDDPEAALVLQTSGVDLNRLRADVSAYLGTLYDEQRAGRPVNPGPDPELLRILKAAADAAHQSRRRQIDGAIVVAALVGDGKSPAAGMLRAHGLTFETAIRALQQVNTAAGAGPARTPPQRPQVAAAVDSVRAPAAAPSRPEADPAPASPKQSQTDDLLASVRARLKKSEPVVVAPAAPKPVAAVEPREPAVADPGAAATAQVPIPGDPRVGAAQLSEYQPPVAKPSAARMPMPPPIPVAPSPAVAAAAPETSAPPPAARVHPGWTPPPLGQGGRPVEAAPEPAAAAAPGSADPARPVAVRAVRPGEGPVRPPLPGALGPQIVAANGPLPQAGPRNAMNGSGGHGLVLPPGPPQLRQAGPPGSARLPAGPPGRLATPVQAGAPPPAAVPIEIGSAVNAIPKRMLAGRTRGLELRLPRALFTEAGVAVPGPGMRLRSEFGLNRAITLRLAGTNRRLAVELRSPETLWIAPGQSGRPEDDLVWHWDLTGLEPGVARVRLSGAVRTLAPDGSSSETQLAEQIVDIRVRRSRSRLLLGIMAATAWGLIGAGLEWLWEHVVSGHLPEVLKFMGF